MARNAIIISNIGTPNSPNPSDVAKYLREFLMDEYVIDIPWLPRFFLVKGIIAPFRSKRSAKAYKKIWEAKGSPLMLRTQEFAGALEKQLGSDYRVVVGMRYGQPSMAQALEAVKDCDRIFLFPQYPQYAESSSRTCEEHFYRELKRKNIKRNIQVIPAFFDHGLFIEALAENVKMVTGGAGLGSNFDHILFSYHGLPERHLTKIDPIGGHCGNYKTCCERPKEALRTCYRAQAFATSRALAAKLGLKSEDYTVSFQSRLGKQVWIPPYTDIVFEELAQKGVRRLAVICPSFVADCLETLEEIAIEGRRTFLEAGGKAFAYIPCPNVQPKWIQAGADLVLQSQI